MKSETIVIGILCFALGVMTAVVLPKYFKPTEVDITNQMPAPPPPQNAPAPSANLIAAVKQLESLVKNDPNNLKLRLQLGHAYFDSGAYGKAIPEYELYLEKNPDDADVRTDLGICYRRTGNSQRAVEEFEKAAKSNPNHLNSRLNAGIVSYYDLKDFPRALKNWESYLKIAPADSRAQEIRKKIDEIKAILGEK
ncbi:MAG: tetratricopeptide repeat protein [Candidatus Schekmanbacteria bacterium]|nr:MAG: tetratricopeptide repeat protein [Candidatus Schekmanbacteria bacterium]